jgi:hypothetical protein
MMTKKPILISVWRLKKKMTMQMDEFEERVLEF